MPVFISPPPAVYKFSNGLNPPRYGIGHTQTMYSTGVNTVPFLLWAIDLIF